MPGSVRQSKTAIEKSNIFQAEWSANVPLRLIAEIFININNVEEFEERINQILRLVAKDKAKTTLILDHIQELRFVAQLIQDDPKLKQQLSGESPFKQLEQFSVFGNGLEVFLLARLFPSTFDEQLNDLQKINNDIIQRSFLFLSDYSEDKLKQTSVADFQMFASSLEAIYPIFNRKVAEEEPSPYDFLGLIKGALPLRSDFEGFMLDLLHGQKTLSDFSNLSRVKQSIFANFLTMPGIELINNLRLSSEAFYSEEVESIQQDLKTPIEVDSEKEKQTLLGLRELADLSGQGEKDLSSESCMQILEACRGSVNIAKIMAHVFSLPLAEQTKYLQRDIEVKAKSTASISSSVSSQKSTVSLALSTVIQSPKEDKPKQEPSTINSYQQAIAQFNAKKGNSDYKEARQNLNNLNKKKGSNLNSDQKLWKLHGDIMLHLSEYCAGKDAEHHSGKWRYYSKIILDADRSAINGLTTDGSLKYWTNLLCQLHEVQAYLLLEDKHNPLQSLIKSGANSRLMYALKHDTKALERQLEHSGIMSKIKGKPELSQKLNNHQKQLESLKTGYKSSPRRLVSLIDHILTRAVEFITFNMLATKKCRSSRYSDDNLDNKWHERDNKYQSLRARK